MEAHSAQNRSGVRVIAHLAAFAVLPVAALIVFSLGHEAEARRERAEQRLEREIRLVSASTMHRLECLHHVLENISLRSYADETLSPSTLPSALMDVSIVGDRGDITSVAGVSLGLPSLSERDAERLRLGKSVVTLAEDRGVARLVMVHALRARRGESRYIVASVDPAALWSGGIAEDTPDASTLTILDHRNHVLYESRTTPLPLIASVDQIARSVSGGQLVWRHESHPYLASFGTIALRESYGLPHVTAVVSRPLPGLTAPLYGRFGRLYLLVTLGTIVLVALAGSKVIRNTLAPLRLLLDAARRMAAGDFDARVRVDRDDEIGALGDAFNAMSDQLGRKFRALNAIAEIDREVLSTLDLERIVAAILTRMPAVVSCDAMCMSFVDTSGRFMKVYFQGADSEVNDPVVYSLVDDDTMNRFREATGGIEIRAAEDVPKFLEPLVEMGMRHFSVLPAFEQDTLFALIGLGFRTRPESIGEEIARARSVMHQVAVAMSNARLVEELDDLNWGTLRALARAIDAKSPWTSGHSERVTRLALKIGRVLGLTDDQLRALHRGGLLHDIGKIGISQEILDKPGRLTAEETRTMQGHVDVGARILEPIKAYGDALPIVRQHHEWFNGGGYPEGLSGEQISLAARIFAVADCFDSLNSDRPYRNALGREEAVAYVWHQSGKQFDPQVVSAFMLVMGEEGKQHTPESPSMFQTDTTWEMVTAGRDQDA